MDRRVPAISRRKAVAEDAGVALAVVDRIRAAAARSVRDKSGKMNSMEPVRGPFAIRHRPAGPVHVVEVIGDIDIFTSADLSDALDQAAGATRIIVDLSHCGYIDSTGISSLFRSQRSSNGKLCLVVGSGHKIRRILQVTRVGEFIQIYESVEEARAS